MKVASNAMMVGAALLALSAYSSAATSSGSNDQVGPVTITGKRAPSDQEVTRRVETALDSDPYVYAAHVSVTTTDGVVTLHGMVGDEWDLLGALRISSRVDGVRRVVDDLEIWDLGVTGS